MTTTLTATPVGRDPVVITKGTVRDDPPFSVSGVPALTHLLPGRALTLQVTCSGAPTPQRSHPVTEHRTGGAYVESAADVV